MPKLDSFFESNIVKSTFESAQNLLVSSAVIIAGQYLIKVVSPKAVWEITTFTFGWILALTGAALFVTSVLDVHYKISKNILHPVKRWAAALLYFFISTLAIITILQLNSVSI